MFEACLGIFVTAFIWGVTDPLMKKFSNYPSVNNLLTRTIPFLANWQYSVTFALNQIGSASFLWTLNKSPLSLAVPVTNSLKFLFTYVTGQLIGESPLTKRSAFGLFLILCGILLQIFDNVNNK